MSRKGQEKSKKSNVPHTKHNPLFRMLHRNKEGGILQEDYEIILYYILYHAKDHRLSRPDTFQKMEEGFRDIFSSYDWEIIHSQSKPRWMHHTDWARKKMVNRGHLVSNPRGVWNLTPSGLAYAESCFK